MKTVIMVKGTLMTRQAKSSAAVRDQEASDRDKAGRFAKGNKGGGRPPEYKAFKERCREFMDDEGFPILATKARQGDTFALKLFCEYGYGKAPDAEKPAPPEKTIKIEWVEATRKVEEDG